MKFYCIIPATKDKDGVCVLPTMQEPLGWPGFYETDTDVLNHYSNKVNVWESHLSSLTKFPTSCDRAGWFEGEEEEQVFVSNKWYKWEPIYKLLTGSEICKRRKFIVPQSEEKDGPGSVKIASTVASHSSGSGNSDEQKLLQLLGGKVKYDNEGQQIHGIDARGGMQLLLDLRGWGAIQNLFNKGGKIEFDKAYILQDKLGEWIADAINQKLKKPKSGQEPEVCDARDDPSSNADDKQTPVEQKDERKECDMCDEGTVVGYDWDKKKSVVYDCPKCNPPKVEPQPAPKEDSPEAAEVLKKHTGNVSGFHKLTEWHRKFILAAMKEYAESKYTESEVREAFSEGYEAAIHHENFDKAWREFKNELK
jgi:hypothetical protein